MLSDRLGIPIGTTADDATNLVGYADPSYGLLKDDADCVTGLSYNEYTKILASGFDKNELTEFRFDNTELAMLEDGIWVLQERLNDEKFQDSMVRFVRASMKGWRWAVNNQEQAVKIVLQFMDDTADEEHQHRMMAQIAKLIADSTGALELDAYNRTAEIALDLGIISKPPQGAWTSDITDNAGLHGAD